MQKLENLANMLDRAECPEEAEFVRDLWQQRAELLEALKMVQAAAVDMRGEDFNLTTEQWAMFHTAITKVEATE